MDSVRIQRVGSCAGDLTLHTLSPAGHRPEDHTNPTPASVGPGCRMLYQAGE